LRNPAAGGFSKGAHTMNLYFLRHGLTGQRVEWHGSDFDRPLTEDGKERMMREAAAIKKLKPRVEVIITSPLVRAYQTAKIVAKQLNLLDRFIIEELLKPGFGPDTLPEIIRKYAEAGTLLLVGHEPDFSSVISHIIGGGRVVCKKGGLAFVDLQQPHNLQGELVWLIPPKLLGA
jgi:phosphohistidine phosphatase